MLILKLVPILLLFLVLAGQANAACCNCAYCDLERCTNCWECLPKGCVIAVDDFTVAFQIEGGEGMPGIEGDPPRFLVLQPVVRRQLGMPLKGKICGYFRFGQIDEFIKGVRYELTGFKTKLDPQIDPSPEQVKEMTKEFVVGLNTPPDKRPKLPLSRLDRAKVKGLR